MSREGGFRQRVLAAFRAAGAVACWVDVGCGGTGAGRGGEDGTPDVFWAGGALELKALPGWPAREETVVKIEHLTREQIRWGWDWEQGGGRWGLLVTVDRGRGLYLFDARGAVEVYRGLARAGWQEWAVWWRDGSEGGKLGEVIKFILAQG